MRTLVAVVVVLACATLARADDLQRAEQLAWNKQFRESEALYRQILTRTPQSHAAQLGLARVLMWQGRYDEAIELFSRLEGVDALEGKATAEYWSGDLRRAARDFERVLAIDANRETARRSLDEIRATAVPTQRIATFGTHDDQPYDTLRAQLEVTFFSDPQTRWGVIAGAYQLDAGRVGDANGEYVLLDNETRLRAVTFNASLGAFTFPDGVRRPIGSLGVRYRRLSLRVEHREELASATSLRTHASSTTTALRWDYDRNVLAAAEISQRDYFDDNRARAVVAYAVVPIRRHGFTYWLGASATARDADESRFRITATSSELDGTFFRYRYRGEYDPYWTPDDLFEARAVVAVERRFTRGGFKLHGDAGYAQDRGRAFGPDVGPGPFPPNPYTFAFDRNYDPWRAGVTGDFAIAPSLRLEAGIEHGATVDYRSTTFHAALVRRR